MTLAGPEIAVKTAFTDEYTGKALYNHPVRYSLTIYQKSLPRQSSLPCLRAISKPDIITAALHHAGMNAGQQFAAVQICSPSADTFLITVIIACNLR
jgi:hypothetical protein